MFPALVVMIFMLQGCFRAEPVPPPSVPDGFPARFVSGRPDPGNMADSSSAIGVAEPWWEAFKSSELNRMVTRSLGSNFTMREIRARLEQAKAQAVEKRSLLSPMVTLGAGASHKRKKENGRESTMDTISLGPGASYEVDLWNRIKSQARSGELIVSASRFDLETAGMTLAAEIANTWVDQIAAIKTLDLVKQQLATNTQLAKLLVLRFENALSTSLDVLQQQEILAGVRAQIPPLERQLKQLSNRLNLLQGEAPSNEYHGDKIAFPLLDPLPAPGIPADLLSKRPDIRAAELRLMAGKWDRRAEHAARLPAINLTGSMGLDGSGLDGLFDSWALSLGAAVVGTLYDGGKKAAAEDRAAAVVTERFAFYEKTVFTALAEVEDALADEIHQREWLDALDQELDAARLALGEATRRYQKGLITFLPVVAEQLNVQRLERGLIVQQAGLVKARIGLHRALGGVSVR